MNNEQIKSHLEGLCARSEQAPQDMLQKAVRLGLDPEEAEELIEQLKEEHYLDASRYAMAFVNDKFRFEHWGRVKISYALRNKGIDDSVISIALDEKIDPEDYLETCCNLMQSRMRGMELPLSQNDRARLYRFLAQRGFESSVISRAFDTLE